MALIIPASQGLFVHIGIPQKHFGEMVAKILRPVLVHTGVW